jgi:hypothetical protein
LENKILMVGFFTAPPAVKKAIERTPTQEVENLIQWETLDIWVWFMMY